MNVLSLFDGMSGGQIALKELGITPEKYYASEIDKHAIAQTKLNFPNTIHIGSVVDVDVTQLEPIDLLIGGSPCQSFSFAGKRKGMATKCEIEITKLEQYLKLKEQGFEFEGQSYLFWEYMRILTDIRQYNPNVLFLLENVEMGDKWERVLSEAIGIFGVHINSALVSAQNRKRIYWFGYMMERFFFEENYCIECEHKKKEYEQKREQGLLGEAQREGAESILGEAQKRRVGLQNLRQKLSEDREKRNNKNMFEGVPILAEERKRQEQEQGESCCLQEKVLSREQDPADRIPAPTQKNGCREGANEESRFRFIKEMQKENADTFTKRDGWEYFHKNERLHLYNKHEANMCCVCCGKRLDYRPHNSVITWGDKRDYQPPSVMSKVQFEKTRQDDGRVFDVVKVRVRSSGLFGELYSDIPQPEDRGILLRDILEENVDEKYFLSDRMNTWLNKHSEKNQNKEYGFGLKIKEENDKCSCLTSGQYKQNLSADYLCVAMRGREACLTPKRTEYGKSIRKKYEAGIISEQRKNIQQLEPRTDGKTNCITSVQKDNLVVTSNYIQLTGTNFDSDNRFWFENGKHAACVTRGFDKTGVCIEQKERGFNKGSSFYEKSPTLSANSWEHNNTLNQNMSLRRLTPTECSRLQTVPSWYKWQCSETQQYKLLGNGWTIEAIKHILKYFI